MQQANMENKKPKKKMRKKVKCLEHSKNAKITIERCKKIRKFLKRQCAQTGQDLAHLLGQSLSRCEVRFFSMDKYENSLISTILQVAQIVQHQCEQKTLDNDIPVGLVSTEPKVEIKVEAHDEENHCEMVSKLGMLF